uniref:MYND-type domain-containing protein n=1 Tax=Photinus pyralis TaxID=7054 RepID=A0A1Y1MM28_PHOPY
MSNVPPTVDLGFAVECDAWKLESRLFPSKIGGKPAWLDLANLPNSTDLQCNLCHRQMIFLCQIYAPFEEDENNFHRTLFVFICRNSECSVRDMNNNLKVYRSNLPRVNTFYSEEPPLEEPDFTFSLSKWIRLCQLCGCVADKSCSKCKVAYCCREHQVIHWKQGHKNQCGSEVSNTPQSTVLFKEYELVIETEADNPKEKEATEAWKEYQQLESEGNLGSMAHISETELQAHSYAMEDRTFLQFRKRTEMDPDQVIRYERGGKPLWIADKPVSLSVPNCELCNGPRQFEVQIMPQMLSVLGENDLDWGTLVIYTCISSCTDRPGYKREFVLRQDVSNE